MGLSPVPDHQDVMSSDATVPSVPFTVQHAALSSIVNPSRRCEHTAELGGADPLES